MTPKPKTLASFKDPSDAFGMIALFAKAETVTESDRSFVKFADGTLIMMESTSGFSGVVYFLITARRMW